MRSATLHDSQSVHHGPDGEASQAAPSTSPPSRRPEAPPRLGFLGTGWIGRHRMEAIHRSGAAQVAMICDPSEAMVAEARATAPEAEVVPTFELMLSAGLDGIVIATPSALHAEQTVQALESGASVFCQKPLGRSERETAWVINTARRADLLLGVDLSYRFTEGMRRIREILLRGEIGDVFAAELVFHNAYGPDKDWFYNVERSGGGCVMDLGIHLVDLALWSLNSPGIENVSSRLFAGGEPLAGRPSIVEDFGTARIDLQSGATIHLACSWRLPVGCEARIEVAFYGTQGGLRLRNVEGSFYDFVAERFHGTTTELLSSPPDDWGGRAAVDWAERLAAGSRFDPEAESLIEVARVLDRVYGR